MSRSPANGAFHRPCDHESGDAAAAHSAPAPGRASARFLFALLAALLGLRAQPAMEVPAARPQFSVPLLPAAAVIDGDLDEEVWRDAAGIREFRQVEPDTGSLPTQPTEVRVFHNGRSLFIGVRAEDSDPAAIIARELKRDAELDGDDRFSIVIDSLGDQRNGYLFQTNPLAARYDALIIARTLNKDWNGIWDVRTRITSGGWSAEFEIPFATLSFQDDGRPWGLNFERAVIRRQESTRWSAVTRNQRIWHVGNLGRATGLERLDVGRGIDFKPYGKVSWGSSDRDLEADGGFELFAKLTPTSSVALTVNPDFADTDVDDRVINVTKYPTFLPEKREFFLRDAGIFQFGGITDSPLAYFSRRMGLTPQGRSVEIPVGLRLTGWTDRWTFGLIDTQVRDPGGGTRNLGVARARINLWEESTGGFIFTHGSPQAGTDDWLGGLDFNYRISNWRGDRSLGLNVFALQSGSPSTGAGGGAYGVSFDHPTDRINITASVQRVDEKFAPPLGFIRQTGIYRAKGKIVYRWRPGGRWDRIDWGTYVDYVTDLAGELDYFEASIIDTTWFTLRRDSIGGSWFVYRERLDRPLMIGPGLPVQAGIYDTDRVSMWFRTGSSRRYRFNSTVSYGGLYDGTAWQTSLSLGGRASRFLHAFLDYDLLDASLPNGRFEIHNLGVRADVLFSPDLALMLVGQWDNLSEDLGMNLRLRWTPRPDRELVVVFSQNVSTLSGWQPLGSRLVSKAAWTFRF